MKLITNAGEVGLNIDGAAYELAPNAWSYGQNMRFRNGYAERMSGQAQIFTTPSITPYWLTSYRSGTSKYWVHLGPATDLAGMHRYIPPTIGAREWIPARARTR